VPTIRVPVLIAIGDSDALFPPPAVARAKSIYRTGDLTAITVGDTGHALNLERSAGASALTIALWLCAHSFCDPAE
jgi:pimeloyl-ACP methyl ester carboxylesterase